MAQRSDLIPLQGGLDAVSPSMMVKPGMAIAASNYEIEARGYRRMAGYERFDGRSKPSAASYLILPFYDGSAAIAEDAIVTGLTSGASGAVVAAPVPSSGSWAGGDAQGDLAIHAVTGTFQVGEALQVGGSSVALLESAPLTNGALDDATNSALIAAVTQKRRDAIGRPAGSGPIRGVATYKGDVYCWRDNAAGTAGVMFKATPDGWVAQSAGRLLKFTAGMTGMVEGETITGTTSGATATVERVILQMGAWDGAGVGYLVLSGVTGAFASGEGLSTPTGSATANGADTAITLPPGGKYRAIQENFYATDGMSRLYFANGEGPAMEWDGAVLAPVLTGAPAALERPQFVAVHRLHLFLGYRGGALQHSAPGEPLVFDAVRFAGEIGFGQDLTGLKSNTRDSLIITGRNKIGYLVGSDNMTFELRSISEDSGAIPDTLEIVGSPIFLDDQGVRDMQAAETYGDWKVGTMTRMIEPLLRSKKEAGIAPVGALRVRGKDQYRLHYADGTGIMLYFGRQAPEAMTFSLGMAPTCLVSGEAADGYEMLLAGDADGWVYEIDRGTSFDGGVIEAFLRTSWMNQGAPNVNKRYHRARLEGQAGRTNTDLAMVADYGYGSPDLEATKETPFTFFGGGGFWDEANWNEFVWSSQVEGQAFAELEGIGENVSVVFMSSSATEEPHTLSTLTINYTPRRRLR